ncbi:1-hydroxycarotenoid 3,4-desaturase CrtD [Rhizobium sp. G187]|uniref:1-hydroxycarotenoid 3,4-desaturase CrtD n=1 Tax=Rhizobium sp. G187 TaxID=3451352 RepID=UPI003EE5B307
MSGEQGGPVLIIGAGMGGLAAAIRLAAAGMPVCVVEGQAGGGGKLRQVEAGGQAFDAGPTVLTMKWVFDDLFKCGDAVLDDQLGLMRSKIVARHYWEGGNGLDLVSDPLENARAIRDFAGAKAAEGYTSFAADSRRIYTLLKDSFISAQRPNPITLSQRIGLSRPQDLFAIRPFSSMWSTLGGYFADVRLRQLFARYATYCGSSPYLAPATLMLVAHVEQEGVWLIDGGMRALAAKLVDLATDLGVEFQFGDPVSEIVTDPSRNAVSGAVTRSGRRIAARRVIFNGDVAALPRLLGRPSQPAKAIARRSLSAVVACGPAEARGVPLAHHTVFFSSDYAAEFDAIFRWKMPPADPTVYVCAQDRDGAGNPPDGHGSGRSERLYSLMNMPADGDRHQYDESEIDRCLHLMERRLASNGLTLRQTEARPNVTTPDRFARLYPGSGGALYGMASHGCIASFARPGAKGPVPGLYLAGGSVHPGPGVPMSALSGKLAADQLMQDMGSTRRFRQVAIAGGMSTPSAIADNSH